MVVFGRFWGKRFDGTRQNNDERCMFFRRPDRGFSIQMTRATCAMSSADGTSKLP
jgi:hypothetical protein